MKRKSITSSIKTEMAKGGGTPREICDRLNADPEVKKLSDGKEIRVQAVATTLHKGDVRRNTRGWCESEEGRPLRYSLTGKSSKGMPPGIALATLLVPLLAFLRTLNIFPQVLTARSGQESAYTEYMPDVFGAALPEMPATAAHSRVSDQQARTVACVVIPAITTSSLEAAMADTAMRTRWAHDGYLATASIEGGDASYARLKILSENLRVGVILIDASDKGNRTRIIESAPALGIDSETRGMACFQMPERPTSPTDKLSAFFTEAAQYCTYQLVSAKTAVNGHNRT